MVVTGYVISMPRYSFRFGPVEIRQRIAPYNVQLGRVLLVGGLGLQQRAAFQRVDTSLSLPNGEWHAYNFERNSQPIVHFFNSQLTCTPTVDLFRNAQWSIFIE